MGYFKICSKSQLKKFRKIDAHTRRRIRAIIIKQKKRSRYLYKHLRARKISGMDGEESRLWEPEDVGEEYL